MPLLAVIGLSLFFGCGLPQGQAEVAPLDAKVTFSEPAAPLVRLMPRLADATKLPVKVSPAMATEVVCVAVHDVTARDLLEHIATATGGEWTQSSGAYYLGPSNSAREALKQKAYAARTVLIAKDLKSLDPASKKPDEPKDSQPGAVVIGHLFGNQGDPVFFQLLSAIGAQQLASLLPGDRAVLSSRPTPKQYPLPNCDEIITAYVRRVNADIDKAAANGGSDDGDDEGGPPVQMPWATGNKKITRPPAKVDLVLSRTEGLMSMIGGGGVSADLVLYDAAGKEIHRDHANVGSFDAGELAEMMTGAQHATTSQPEAPLQLSDETKQFVKLVNSMNQPGKKTMTEEARRTIVDHLMHPDLFEPLAYPADLLQAYAKAKDLQLVASLPDAFSAWLMLLMGASTTPKSVEHRLDVDTDLVTDRTAGWLTISPGNPSSEPISRADLAKIVAGLYHQKNPSIDLLAEAALAGLGDPEHGMLPEFWLALVDPSQAMLMAQDWPMLRLYGTLSSDQRSYLAAGRPLQLSNMSDNQRAMVERMVYGADSGLQMFGNDAPLRVEAKRDNSVLGGAEDMFSDTLADFGYDGQSPNDYRGEPTEAAPNGLPGATTIRLKVTTSQVLQIEPKGKDVDSMPYYNQPMQVEQIASFVAMRDSPQFSQMSAYFPTFDHVRLGTQRHLHFRIYVSDESFKSSTLSDASFPENSSYSLSALPGDLQTKFDKTLKEMREAYRNAGSGDDGGAAPP